MISGNIWYHLTWQMMLDIKKCINFFLVKNKYPASRFICHNFDQKTDIDNQKVHAADEMKRDMEISQTGVI